jgi:hypothetical protein
MVPSYQLIEPFHPGAGPPYKVFKGTNLGTIDRAAANAVVQLGHFRKNGINNQIIIFLVPAYGFQRLPGRFKQVASGSGITGFAPQVHQAVHFTGFNSMIQFLKIDIERSYQLLSPC